MSIGTLVRRLGLRRSEAPATPKRSGTTVRALIVGLGVCALAPTAPRGISAYPTDGSFVPDEVIVQFRHGSTEGERRAALRSAAVSYSRAIGPPQDGLVLATATGPVGDAIARLKRRRAVEFAEPNWIVRRAATSNDPQYTNGSLWGMYGDTTSPANTFGSQAGELWGRGYTGLASVAVGVIDSGIDVTHPDLAPNIWINPHDLVDGIDNDGNGFVDDVHGWDFVNQDNTLYDGTPANLSIDAHGTHVAGVVGARGGNALGVAGINWNVAIIGAKVIDASGFATTDATVAAIRYITDLKVRHGISVAATNNSWTGAGYSLAVHQAIIQAAKQGILFVAASGDGGFDSVGDDNDAIPSYPSNYATNVAAGSETAATYDSVISVTALTATGELAPYANFGPTTVDLGAPGTDITSTTPQGGYGRLSGTSMAAPHVAGAVAIYASMNPGTTAAQRRQAILAPGISTPSLGGRSVSGRRLNVGDFIEGSLPTLSIDELSLREGHSGTTNAVFTVRLSAPSTGSVTVNYESVSGTAVGGAHVHRSPIDIPSGGAATPYPSTITVPTGLGTITRLGVVLRGLRHDFPADLDLLLVGPDGKTCLLMSDVGGVTPVSDVTLTFDDAGARIDQGQLQTGIYQPTNNGASDLFPGAAPAGPYGSSLADFVGTSPTGDWRLFVVDDLTGFGGSIVGGWSLQISATSADFVGSSGTLTFPPGTTTRTVTVQIVGDTVFEQGESFTIELSGATGATIAIGPGNGTIRNDDFSDDPLQPGMNAKAVHIRELRSMVGEVRARRGLPRFEFADRTIVVGTTMIRVAHIVELRGALAEACPPPTYTDPTIVAGVTQLRAAHITELRAAVLACDAQ